MNRKKINMSKVIKKFKITDGLLESLWLLGYVDFYTVLKGKYFDEEWKEDCYIIEISASSVTVIDSIISKSKEDIPFGTPRIEEIPR